MVVILPPSAAPDCITLTHGSSDGAAAAEDRPAGGGDLRLAAQGVGQHRPHPRRRGDLRGVHPGPAGRPRRHLGAAAAQHRPRGRRPVPAGRRGVPRQRPRGRLLPLRLARVQLLHLRPSEERAGLGIAAAQLLGRPSRGDAERVGRLRRQPVAVPRPAGRGVPRHPLHQQAGGLHQGTPAPEKVRRRRQPDRLGDQGAGQEDAPVAASIRPQAPGQLCRLCLKSGTDASVRFFRPMVVVLCSLDCLRRRLSQFTNSKIQSHMLLDAP